MRLFCVSRDQRTVRVEDFHAPAGESDAPATRTLSVEVTLSFSELDTAESGRQRKKR
ncbi:plasmid-like protein [Mycolicibacterium vaccae ATCC 25954]|uniref:Plasmid-like protein n=1 Tax=Mycolicibacterium vaccae ATCC 25954 TaxID=1194972 RepID=K0V6F4_MYCVA|nr:plasmid-like protein [Mycolicibacterium vaccae ATCC 25954]